MDKFIRVEFDGGKAAGLHVRRAVAESIAKPDKYHRKPDMILRMSGETWAKLYLSQVTLEDLIKSGDLKTTDDPE